DLGRLADRLAADGAAELLDEPITALAFDLRHRASRVQVGSPGRVNATTARERAGLRLTPASTTYGGRTRLAWLRARRPPRRSKRRIRVAGERGPPSCLGANSRLHVRRWRAAVTDTSPPRCTGRAVDARSGVAPQAAGALNGQPARHQPGADRPR